MPDKVGYAAESITQADTEAAEKLWQELETARAFRQSRERIWRRSERQYQGRTWRNRADDPTTDLINVNMSFSTINTIMPHLTGMEPEFIVAPFSADATPKNARIQEAFLNRMWKHKPVGAQRALIESTFDYLIYGDGYMKTTWRIQERSISVDETTSRVDIFIDRVSPWDVWLDPVATGLDKGRWAAIRLWTTEEAARDDETLRIPKGYEFSTIDPTTSNENDQGEKPYHATSGGSEKWVELYELYDIFNQKMYVVPFEGDKRPWKVIEGIEIPLVQVSGYTIAQSPYHMGDLEQIWDIQLEIDKTRSQQIAHRKRNVTKVFVKKDAISPEAESALTSSVVGEIVPIEGEMPLNELVMPLQMAPLPSESYAMAAQAQSDIGDITGITEYQRGAAPDITRTATEAQIMQGASNVKIDAKLNTIELAVRNVGEYMLAVAKGIYPQTDVDEMAMFIGGADGRAISQLQAGDDAKEALAAGDTERAGAIAGTAGLFGEAIVTPTDEIFVGNYEVLVEHSSTDAVNPRVKAQKYGEIVQRLVELQPVLQQQGISMDIGRLVRMWLEAEGIPGVDAILSGAAPQQQGAPQDPNNPQALPPDPLEALLGGGGGGPPGPPVADIGPDNSGSLDPNLYPAVGV